MPMKYLFKHIIKYFGLYFGFSEQLTDYYYKAGNKTVKKSELAFILYTLSF